ncbi:MAG: FadR/GntR family transcriptional regulator [Candidatus Promineifilaceae bacterium]
MHHHELDSNFLRYLVDSDIQTGALLPPLSDISSTLDVSVGKLREEVSAARAMGVVSTKPRTGTRRQAFDFRRAVLPSIYYGLATEEATFAQLSQLRRGIESSLWEVAVSQLEETDLQACRNWITKAQTKLSNGRIPYEEHRAFHLAIFGRIQNPFAIGMLTAYWDVYDTSEFTRYQSMSYWVDVWHHHERIIAAIASGDIPGSHQLLIDHFNLLKTTPASVNTKESVSG